MITLFYRQKNHKCIANIGKIPKEISTENIYEGGYSCDVIKKRVLDKTLDIFISGLKIQ